MTSRATSHGFAIVAVASLLAASIVATGCGTTTAESVAERNKRLVRRMNAEVWNENRLDAIDELFTPDFVLHFLPDGSDTRGTDSLREHVRQHREAFPDWSEEIRRIVAERDLVVIHYVSSGTNRGRWLGKPETGRTVRINEVSIFRIEDGRIAEQWLLPDLYNMQRQLAGTGPE